LLGSVVAVKDFVEKLPRRLNRILDIVSLNQLKVRVATIDGKAAVGGLPSRTASRSGWSWTR
jgi:hypothetical protein